MPFEASAEILARIQFAFTVSFHFIFPFSKPFRFRLFSFQSSSS